MRHLDAEAARDLVAHAGIAVFHVVAAGRRRRQSLCSSPGRPPAAQTTTSLACTPGAARHRCTCASVGSAAFAGAVIARRRRFAIRPWPLPPRSPQAWAPSSRRAPRRARQAQCGHRRPAAALRCLRRVERLHVEAEISRRSGPEQRPGAGGEILRGGCRRRATTIGLRRQRIGRAGAGDADRAQLHRMLVRRRRFAGLGLAHRNAASRRKVASSRSASE